MEVKSPIVNVLISTYNGEKYIKEQLDSIFNQSYDNISIYVRDDGSTDSTLDIVNDYISKGKSVRLIPGENIGFGKSFMSLLKIADDGDYWAFCDQDDVWYEDKIKWAVEYLETQDYSRPLMYHSSYLLADENLENGTKSNLWNQNYTFAKSLTEVIHMGFSCVINSEMRDLMLRAEIENISSHDHWAELLAVKYGRIYEDDRVASIHRRLTESQSSSSLYARFRWLKGAMKGKSEILPVAKEYCRVFADNRDKDWYIANLFVSDRYSITKSLKKALYPHRWRSSISSEIVLRTLMLIGKV
ncbi:Glycosyltransferase involved in cell wall bisynthesis [Pseudobutyrivibrio ruminis]|uniref:Glycosyltransferase involved in cell wall bisynthesis n=1 Tax=Pseudobutyrivibrio ruminis TaxID=46206 RepID=A0A1H7H6L6_9FIRM|nr:glycosyltransferase [Pseudobutyrivibrio ruminis]SEK46073.1 Glycosyltransferase involved in cell wall bisynthesis [Pseudobutyrivibrio ruminis]